MSIPIAIFASGRGSGFQSIVDAVKAGKLDAEIVALVSDKPGALAIERAKAAGIKVLVVPPPAPGPDRRRVHEHQILEALAPCRPKFVVLAGYMRVLTSHLIEAFRSERGYTRMINVHPSLLPAFPGVNSYAQAFDYGTKLAGVSVHLVELEVDAGPICAQESFSIADCKSAEEVEKRGLAIEHRLYPETLSWVLKETFAYQPPREGRGGRIVRSDA